MSNYERITKEEIFDGKVRDSHEARYHIASCFVGENDSVLDAGCGTGYGKEIIGCEKYLGIDYKPLDGFTFHDFENGPFEHDSDVFMGLEIIEHLSDIGVENFVKTANQSKKFIIISTPIIPNKNPFHKQNFTKDDIIGLFKDHELYQYFEQNEIYGIFIFKIL